MFCLTGASVSTDWFHNSVSENEIQREREASHARRCSSLDEMNETMIERWNESVKKGDRVYHLNSCTSQGK